MRAGAARGVRLWLVVLVVVVLYGLLSRDLGWMHSVANAFMFVALVQAWNVLGGYGGYMNFGMAAFFGVGAYTTGILFQSFALPAYITTLAAGVMGMAFGLMVGLLTLRLRGAYFAIFTLIVTFAVQLATLTADFTQGSLGIYLPILSLEPRQIEQLFYFVFLLIAVLSTVAVYLVERSRFGVALVAIREDEDAAEALGIRTTRVKVAALMIGGLIAGVAGGIYSRQVLYIEPIGTFAIDTSLNVVLMAVVGGAGSWQGPLLGVPLVMLVADGLRVGIEGVLNRVILGVLLVLVALLMPDGVTGLIQGRRRRRLTV